MKTIKSDVVGVIIAVGFGITCFSGQAQPGYATNLVVYNFNSDQVTGVWGGAGADFTAVQWDSSADANTNPASGSMLLTVHCNGGAYLLLDGLSPAYGPLPLAGSAGNVVFTNLSWDMRVDGRSAIRTNTAAAGINGSQGPGSLDFGYMRVGTKGGSFGQDWYYYWAVPATNGLGQPNTNWIHMSVDLTHLVQNFPDLANGIVNTMFGQDDANFGNNVLHGNQYIWFDNITYSGWVGTASPQMTIQRTIPALRIFGGSGSFGRAQIAITAASDGWIGGTYPVSYSFTVLDNATSPGALDYHIHFIQNTNGYSGADFTASNVLWLQIISGSGMNTACVANVSWKTNAANSFPNQHNVALTITNPVLAGTWTLTFLRDTNGTLTAPGAGPVPFTINLDEAAVHANFGSPIETRFGIQNNGNAGNSGVPHDWANISVSGTGGVNFTNDFTQAFTNTLDSTIWDLSRCDGVGMINLVPTNAPCWVIWSTPDTGFLLQTATNLNGPWRLPGYYNNCLDCTNLGTLQAGQKWNLMLPQYLPTADGLPGGPLSPTAYFRLATVAP